MPTPSPQLSRSPYGEDDLLPLNTQREVITCPPNVTIRHAASLMSKHNVGSIIIAGLDRHPKGIVTDTDLRRKVVAGVLSPDHPVDVIMSAPVYTIAADVTVAKAILTMMRYKVRHLCVTADGTPNASITGIVSEHDILLTHGNNPAVLVKEMLQTGDITQLSAIRNRAEELVQQYLQQEVSLHFVADIISEVNDALLRRLITDAEKSLTETGFQKPDLQYCWLSFGSEGRREQLLRTDQDNALVYEEPPKELEGQAHEYFLRLGKEVCQRLVACGFESCPGNNMAGNPQWCQPVSVWRRYFHDWIHVPNEEALLNATIFFDFRPAHGDERLARSLRQSIADELKFDRTSLILLAKNTVHNPDGLNVLGKFVTERKGEHKGLFDVKLRGTKAITDAARVLALDLNLQSSTSTVERLRGASVADPANSPVYLDSALAFERLLRHRVMQGFQRGDSGRFISLAGINRIDKEVVRNSLLAAKELQSLIRVRYQLDALGLR